MGGNITYTLSLFQKLNFGKDSQMVPKSKYQNFLVLSNFTGFLQYVWDVMFGTPWANKNLLINQFSRLQTVVENAELEVFHQCSKDTSSKVTRSVTYHLPKKWIPRPLVGCLKDVPFRKIDSNTTLQKSPAFC